MFINKYRYDKIDLSIITTDNNTKEVEMEEKLNFLSRLRISVFKVKQYSLFLKDGLNKAIGYILILSIIVGIILGATQFAVLTTLEKSAKIILEQEEFEFEINDGILDFKSSPYKEEAGSNIVIIDSNKTLNDLEGLRQIIVHKDRSSVFLKDGIVARTNGMEYKIEYSKVPFLNGNINNEILLNAIENGKVIKYVIFIAMILITYIVALFNALVISLAGQLSNKMNGSKLKYKDIFKISIYSLTLPMLMKLIIPIGSLSIIISAVYVAIAINIISREINS